MVTGQPRTCDFVVVGEVGALALTGNRRVDLRCRCLCCPLLTVDLGGSRPQRAHGGRLDDMAGEDGTALA